MIFTNIKTVSLIYNEKKSKLSCDLQLDGTIVAPTDSKSWGNGLMWWIEFSKLKGIKIQGKGVIDGRGSGWWQQDYPFMDGETKLIVPLNNSVQQHPPMPVRSELDGRMPSIKPTVRQKKESWIVRL